MKNTILAFILICSWSCVAQVENLKSYSVTQKECLNKSGYTLVLKQVTTDSRCPQGLNCIWMGEAQALVAVYNKKKLVEEILITFSPKNTLENNAFFAKYGKEKYKNIQNVLLVPYPKKDVKIKPKDYYIKIEYRK